MPSCELHLAIITNKNFQMKAMSINKNSKLVQWIKRIGFWGFLFFLGKGLVWLALGYFLVK